MERPRNVRCLNSAMILLHQANRKPKPVITRRLDPEADFLVNFGLIGTVATFCLSLSFIP